MLLTFGGCLFSLGVKAGSRLFNCPSLIFLAYPLLKVTTEGCEWYSFLGTPGEYFQEEGTVSLRISSRLPIRLLAECLKVSSSDPSSSSEELLPSLDMRRFGLDGDLCSRVSCRLEVEESSLQGGGGGWALRDVGGEVECGILRLVVGEAWGTERRWFWGEDGVLDGACGGLIKEKT